MMPRGRRRGDDDDETSNVCVRVLESCDDDDDFVLPVCVVPPRFLNSSSLPFVEIVRKKRSSEERVGNRVFRVKESNVTEVKACYYAYKDHEPCQLLFHESLPELVSVRLRPLRDEEDDPVRDFNFDIDRMPPSSYIKFRLRDHPLHSGSLIRIRLRDGTHQLFTANATRTGIVSSNTFIQIEHSSNETVEITEHPTHESLPPIEALGTAQIRARFQYSLEISLKLRRSGVTLLRENPTRSILLTGPSGVGKKTLIRSTLELISQASQNHTQIRRVCCIWIRPEHLLISPSGIEGDASAGMTSVSSRLVRLFQRAARIEPCVVVVEGIEDILMSSSATNLSKQEKRSRMEIRVTISKLLKSYPRVVLVGVTSREHLLTYESVSIFSERVALSLPDASQRAIALEYHLLSSRSSFDKNIIQEKARSCHAFVLRDMEFVAEEAKRLQSLDDEVIRHLKSSLLSASFSVSVPNVSWNLVGGVNVAKRALEEAVIWPSTRSEDLRRMGVKPPRGILLVGPPGVGKTLLAKAVATASRSHFLTASISSLVDAASGESAAKIRDLFSVARQCAPSVVFLDEFQALFGTRDGGSSHSRQLISQLLMEFDQCRYDDDNSKRVFVLAATNVPNAIDRAFFTPGRFDLVLRLNLPNVQGRVDILKGLEQRFSKPWPVKIEHLARHTSGYSGADLASVIRFAVLFAAKRRTGDGTLAMEKCDFENALKHVKASVDDSQLALCGLKRLSLV